MKDHRTLLREIMEFRNDVMDDRAYMGDLLGMILQKQIDGQRASNKVYTVRDNTVYKFNTCKEVHPRYVAEKIGRVTMGMDVDPEVQQQISRAIHPLEDYEYFQRLRWRKDEDERNRTWLFAQNKVGVSSVRAFKFGVSPTRQEDGTPYKSLDKWMEHEYSNNDRSHYPRRGYSDVVSWDRIRDGGTPPTRDEKEHGDPVDLDVLFEFFSEIHSDMKEYRDTQRAALEQMAEPFPKEELLVGLERGDE